MSDPTGPPAFAPTAASGGGRWRAVGHLALAAGLLVVVATRTFAQEPFSDLSGTWWLAFGGGDRGALLIGLSDPRDGTLVVEDTALGLPSFGYSRALGDFFVVAPQQVLTLDSRGEFFGTLELTDSASGAPLGALTVERGKTNDALSRWKSHSSISGPGVTEASSTLRGKRVPETFPVLSGGSPRAQISGDGVKSKAFNLDLSLDRELGLPAYAFEGVGPVEIDGVEMPGTTLSGRVMLSPKKSRLFGRLESSSHFSPDEVDGRLALADDSLVPKLRLALCAQCKTVAKAQLTDAIEPVLRVTPASVDFGALRLDENQARTLDLANVGAGSLSGEARFLDGDGGPFSVESGESYVGIVPGAPPHAVSVRFEPTTAGAATEQILFDVNGGRVGAQIVTVTGVGGIAEISVAPASIAFPDTAVGTDETIGVTVTNVGDGQLQGSATLGGSLDFQLLAAGLGIPQPEIDYDLAPSGSVSFFVRFRPLSTGSKSDTLTLTGGGGATVPVTGDTP